RAAPPGHVRQTPPDQGPRPARRLRPAGQRGPRRRRGLIGAAGLGRLGGAAHRRAAAGAAATGSLDACCARARRAASRGRRRPGVTELAHEGGLIPARDPAKVAPMLLEATPIAPELKAAWEAAVNEPRLAPADVDALVALFRRRPPTPAAEAVGDAQLAD